MNCEKCNYNNKPGAIFCYACEHKISEPKPAKETNKKRSPINKVSAKQKIRNEEKKKAYEKMDSKVKRICSGCGKPGRKLSHSHLIPVSRRPDLVGEEDNIVYHCLSIGIVGCHDIWEHDNRGRVKLLDYQRNMDYIKMADPEYYNLITSKS